MEKNFDELKKEILSGKTSSDLRKMGFSQTLIVENYMRILRKERPSKTTRFQK